MFTQQVYNSSPVNRNFFCEVSVIKALLFQKPVQAKLSTPNTSQSSKWSLFHIKHMLCSHSSREGSFITRRICYLQRPAMTHLHINQDTIKEILIWQLRYTSLQWPTALYKSSATLSSLNNSHQSNNTHTIMHIAIFPQLALLPLLKFPALMSSRHFPGKSAAEEQQCMVKLTYHIAVEQCFFTDTQTAKPLSKHSLRHIHN